MTEKLTGRTRYRASRWRRKLILQVEVTNAITHHDWQTCDSTTSHYTNWRDARVEDLPCTGK